MKIDFNVKEWQHGYLGFILIIADIILKTWVLGILGGILVLDELSQIFIFGQRGGLLHHVYRALYRFKIIRKLNRYLDHLFGSFKGLD